MDNVIKQVDSLLGSVRSLKKEIVQKMEDKINKDKLYITYFCNENISDKTPT